MARASAHAIVLCLVATILYLPASAAQGVAPSSELRVSVAPGPVSIALGGEHVVPVTVTLEAAGFACPQASELAVALAVEHAPSKLAGVMAHLPESITLAVPPGAYASGAQGASSPFNGTVDFDLRIMVGEDAPADHAHTLRAVATFAGGTPAGCLSASPLPSADATAEHAIRTGAALAPPSSPALPSSSPVAPSESAAPAERRAPALGPLAIALAAAAVALLARRSR